MTREQVLAYHAEQAARKWYLVDEAAARAERGDRDALAAFAPQAIAALGIRPGGWHSRYPETVHDALDEIYDRMFPPPRPSDTTMFADPSYVVAVFDCPFPTAQRLRRLGRLVTDESRPERAEVLVGEVLNAESSVQRFRMLRLLLTSPLGAIRGDQVVRVLCALVPAGIDVDLVESAFLRATIPMTEREAGFLWRSSRSLYDGPDVEDAVRSLADAAMWRLVNGAEPVEGYVFDHFPVPRGLRFVLRGLDIVGNRVWSRPEPNERHSREHLARNLCAADLTSEERGRLGVEIASRSEIEQVFVVTQRDLVGDVEDLLEPLGVGAARALWERVRAAGAPDDGEALDSRLIRCDRDAVIDTMTACGVEAGRRLLTLFATRYPAACELFSASMGWNDAVVRRRFGKQAYTGIAAYGLLPLVGAESIFDRYLALQGSAKYGARFGPERRVTHASAIEVALEHLSQLGGYTDVSDLELDMESRVVTDATGCWTVDDYTLRIDVSGDDPVIDIQRGGRALRSVPATLRKSSEWVEARTVQERLRDQRRRLRNGTMERLVATTATLEPERLARLSMWPAGAVLLPGIIWRDATGVIGLLDPATLPRSREPSELTRLTLIDVHGTGHTTTGPFTAMHPLDLYEAGQLAAWQREIIRRRVRQPVKQAFRELYVLTDAERDAVYNSTRFDGHAVEGRIMVKLLAARGWSLGNRWQQPFATRQADGVTVRLDAELLDASWAGASRVLTKTISFVRNGVPMALPDVPSVFFSEAMRDIDLIVGVAGTDPDRSMSRATARGQMLRALADDLALNRVTIEEYTAVVRGSRATYRVHLGSGSIHLDPAGYLCIVPATFGAKTPRELFLPFVDDAATSVILSKVLLLAADEKITDTSILAQLHRLTKTETPA